MAVEVPQQVPEKTEVEVPATLKAFVEAPKNKEERAKAVAEADAADTKLLEGLFEKHGLEQPKTKAAEPARVEAVPEAEEQEEAPVPEQKGSPTEKDGDAATPDADAESSEDEQEYEGALEALRRDGMSRKDIEALGRARIVALGKKRAKSQASVQAMLDERARLLEQVKSGRTGSDAEPEPAKQNAKLDVLKKRVSEEYGEDFAGLFDELAVALRSELPQVQDRSGLVLEMLEPIFIDKARSGLKDRFPGLDDKKVFGKVEEKMATLAKTGSYSESLLKGDFSELMFDAASIVIGHQAPASEKQPAKTKLNGQPHAPSRARPKAAMTPDDWDSIFIRARLDGYSKEEATRLADAG